MGVAPAPQGSPSCSSPWRRWSGPTAYAQILLNAWNQPFYDPLAHKDVSAFIAQLGVFAIGVYGQNLFLDFERRIVVAKLSSWKEAEARLPFLATHWAFAPLRKALG